MTIFNLFTLLGGLAFFLYGMTVMSTGLEKMAGSKLEKILKKMTSNPFKSLLLGAGITIAIQSSSAMTVMLVGLVNSGIMKLGQTIGVIMGSNIGTTLTAWILSLSGVESDNIFLQMLKPKNFSPLVALIGILLIMVSKKRKKKDVGNICVGFAILMFGMELMGSSVEGLEDMPQFTSMMTAFTNPILGVIVGAVITGIIQSSAASVGMLQALSATGTITYGIAFPIIMGQNIGTCVTSLISSIGVNKNAKRVAVVHISFNIIGTAIFLIAFFVGKTFFSLPILEETIGAVGIAACHSVFNVCTTLLLLPFQKLLEKIANVVVKDTDEKEEYAFFDERLFKTPSVAIEECNALTIKMSEIARDTIGTALKLVEKYDDKVAQELLESENVLDMYEDKLGTILVRLSGKSLSASDSRKIARLLHTIGDFERIGDHAVNLVGVAQEIKEKSIEFSDAAKEELHVLANAVEEIITIAVDSFKNNDTEHAAKVEPLEEVIDRMVDVIKLRHIKRLQAGNCTIEHGFVLADLLNNYERVSDHCSNIGVAVIEVSHNSFETHEYLHEVKNMENKDFKENFEYFSQKYAL